VTSWSAAVDPAESLQEGRSETEFRRLAVRSFNPLREALVNVEMVQTHLKSRSPQEAHS